MESLRELRASGTPGKWIYNGNEIVSQENIRFGIAGAMTEEDNRLIVAAVNAVEEISTLQQQNAQLIEALEEAEIEMEQWRDAGHAMACVKVIVNNALQAIKGES